ncbi:hypothetical protein [Streptomyces wuyuanensis]|uniref:hypothetical protein n=1 Tax=Streptomyces wuyuanensis TaxID=1196353 RepID=UPI0034355C9A
MSDKELDVQVAELLTLQADSHDQWLQVEDGLARYGIPVLHSWISDGSVTSRVLRLSGQLVRFSSEQLADQDGVSELVDTTVAVALRQFRKRALAGTGWRPEFRATARTFFMGRCLLTLPTEYKRWIREQRHPGVLPPLPLHDAEHIPAVDPLARPEDLAIERLILRTLLRQADPRTRYALLGVLYGYTESAIAADLGTTAKGVEMLLYRHRHRARLTAQHRRRQPERRHNRHGRTEP